MKFPALVTSVVLAALSAAIAQPPGRPGRGGPPKFELGKLLPPHLRDRLELTPSQQKELDAVEADLKGKLEKLLSTEQKKQIERAEPPMGGPPSGGERPVQGEPKAKAEGAGIQWYTSWEAAKVEATRTNRPILLVSAAPHCAGVSGIW